MSYGCMKSCTETHCPWLTGFVFPASRLYGPLGVVLRNWYAWRRSSPFRAAGLPCAPRNPRGSSPFRTGRKSNMHPRGLEPPARRRAFPERCRRTPTVVCRAFTRYGWPRRLLSVTTFRADVAPPHVGSPSVHARVAGMAKMGGSLPAVALSSREARADRLCNASRSVRPVFLGAALVGWCQTMNMAG